MKYIDEEEDNGSWHEMNTEMPPKTSKVEVLDKNGILHPAEIFVDMSGHYIYFRSKEGEREGWGSLSDYSHWRFRQLKNKA